MPPAKRSGHARLKATLVLRDALCADLGLPLPAAMAQLRAAENEHGTAQALDAGKYLAALASVCSGDTAPLTRIDGEVRTACHRAGLAPRYAQYLALLLFAAWAGAQGQDAEALLARLNRWLAEHPPSDEDITPFNAADLQLAAFWMATAAGKTHVLHACLAMLEGLRTWNAILLITPSEALTRQHADKLRATGAWDVFAYPQDGDVGTLGRLPPGTVIVLDINKLAADKRGDGVTVSTSVFKDGCNLVFVDEGHKGQKSEASTWKALQSDLAGIDAPDARHRGLLIEFSATFGQVAEGEHAFGRYAKSVIFDYAYDRFHQDRYGKDFWHLRIQAKGDAEARAQHISLTAALLAFWHQRTCFDNTANQAEAAEKGLRVASPLWVLLGLSVIGGSGKADKEQTSDVCDVLCFLHEVLQAPEKLAADLAALRALDGDADLLPPAVSAAIAGRSQDALARTVLRDVFGWQSGTKPVFRVLRAATGEMGLGLLHGDVVHYYGVVNVGDAGGLKKTLESAGLAVDEDALGASLFSALDAPGSRVNLLIGSRRFAEGWDNYRASSLTLLRLGQGEGSLIIQMFGRVIRFAGVNGDGKRLEAPPSALAPLQTAYIYGLKSGYLHSFLQGLGDNGVHKSDLIKGEVRPIRPFPDVLQAVVVDAPQRGGFSVEAKGTRWVKAAGRVSVALVASLSSSRLSDSVVSHERGMLGCDLTAAFKCRIPVIDVDSLYHDLVSIRREQQGWWNFAFDRPAIEAALGSDKYTIHGLPGTLDLSSRTDLQRLQRLALTVVRRMFESLYRRHESRHCTYRLIGAAEATQAYDYFKEFTHGS